MPERPYLYRFEGLTEDLPRPSLSALRALLTLGVVVSARAWQELSPDVRVAFARAGAADRVNEAELNDLLRNVPVSQLKFIGKKPEPPQDVIPAELMSVLGPLRPITPEEWQGIGGLDRHVLSALVKNSRLLGKALNEVLPPRIGVAGYASAWAGAVARVEVRLRAEALDRVLRPEFMDGRALILANVCGRRAARRASEVLDVHADLDVGPVEIDWGLREADDVIFWQAHVSAWDGTFLPSAALLAATAAAVSLLEVVRSFDPDAVLLRACVREEPWQAGRDALNETSTAVYAKAVPPAQDSKPKVSDTIVDGHGPSLLPRESRPSPTPAIQRNTVPLEGRPLPPNPRRSDPDARSPAPPAPPAPRAALVEPPSSRRPAAAGLSTSTVLTLIAAVVIANLVAIGVIFAYLHASAR